MVLSGAVNISDFISFLLGLLASGTAIYQYMKKNQLIPKHIQRELEGIIGQAEEYQEKGYTSEQAQALGELIIETIGEVSRAAKKK